MESSKKKEMKTYISLILLFLFYFYLCILSGSYSFSISKSCSRNLILGLESSNYECSNEGKVDWAARPSTFGELGNLVFVFENYKIRLKVKPKGVKFELESLTTSGPVFAVSQAGS